MNDVLRHPATRAWFVLVAATLLLFALAENADAAGLTIVVVFAIAALKVRLVFLYFMELNAGAMPWRAIADVWTFFVTALIVVVYWLAIP